LRSVVSTEDEENHVLDLTFNSINTSSLAVDDDAAAPATEDPAPETTREIVPPESAPEIKTREIAPSETVPEVKSRAQQQTPILDLSQPDPKEKAMKQNDCACIIL
jgi:hypothetical protein